VGIALVGATAEADVYMSVVVRQAPRRAGTRYLRRGADAQGFAANFAESDIVMFSVASDAAAVAASVRLHRGSVPLAWAQRATSFSNRPHIRVPSASADDTRMQKHFAALRELLPAEGELQVVNLLSTSKFERRLREAYDAAFVGFASVRYFPIDTRGMHLHAGEDPLAKAVEGGLGVNCTVWQRGVFAESQSKFVRVNCLDSLDRTSLGQFALLRTVLPKLAASCGVDERVCIKTVRSLWAEHSAAVSLAYSGARALFEHTLRTGTRSNLIHLLRDGTISLRRWWSGLFLDGARQDAVALLTGEATTSYARPVSWPVSALRRASCYALCFAAPAVAVACTVREENVVAAAAVALFSVGVWSAAFMRRYFDSCVRDMTYLC
jgi:hypothetical protein